MATKFSNIVDFDDMVGDFHLTYAEGYETRFNDMVTTNEYRVLINMLGASLYNTYVADQELPAWTDLLNGSEGYEDSFEVIRNWEGLVYLLVPFHYSTWVKINQYHSELTGFVVNNQENSTLLSSHQINVISNNAYNEFLRRYNECFIFLYTNLETYTEFDSYFVHYKPKGRVIKTSIL